MAYEGLLKWGAGGGNANLWMDAVTAAGVVFLNKQALTSDSVMFDVTARNQLAVFCLRPSGSDQDTLPSSRPTRKRKTSIVIYILLPED